ncbi:MAG: DUF2284 domain-containing protein [Clostridia bacterium]|nr:DUF2284 domain-containing protein [Clostridia bacterium]
MNEQTLIEQALACGAAKATIIAQEQIVLSETFRDICQSNGCGNYGKCWMCPPDVGNIDALMEQVRRFPRALLYQSISTIEDSFDIEGMFAAGREHAQLSQRMAQQLKLDGEVLHLTCGGCRICETCAKRENQPCRHPGLPLPSLESYGVDVYQTTKNTELKYINGQNTVTFFGMVLWGA